MLILSLIIFHLLLYLIESFCLQRKFLSTPLWASRGNSETINESTLYRIILHKESFSLREICDSFIMSIKSYWWGFYWELYILYLTRSLCLKGLHQPLLWAPRDSDEILTESSKSFIIPNRKSLSSKEIFIDPFVTIKK